MKKLLKNYNKLLKFNGFYKTFALIIIIVFPAILDMFNFNLDTLIMVFIIGSYSVFSIPLDRISEEKYTQLSMVPYKTKNIIKFLYVHTYIILGISIVFILIINLIRPSQFLLEYLVFISFLLILANIYYVYCASTEFKLASTQSGKKTAIIFHSTIIIFFLWLFIRIIVNNQSNNVAFYTLLSLIILNILISIFTLKKSYKATLKKVMGFAA